MVRRQPTATRRCSTIRTPSASTARPNPQLSFGIGEHFCLGANLARLSLRLLFEELLATIDDIELAAPPRRLHSNLINGIKEMQIEYRPI